MIIPGEYVAACNGVHTLIAGTTGSGKSVLLNGIIYYMIEGSTTELILIDCKRVELSRWKRCKNVKQFVDNPEKAAAVLHDTLSIIDSRYKWLQRHKQTSFPDNVNRLTIIIDELADLLLSPYGKQIKTDLQRILQIARAANIHVLACTQSPSRQVIPAALSVNFTVRYGLHCVTAIESRQAINYNGCESLPKYGECYINNNGTLYHNTIEMIPDTDIQQTIKAHKKRFYQR